VTEVTGSVRQVSETGGEVWAIVVAAGSGSRYGGAKQYEPLGGRRVIDWSLAAAADAADGVVAVVAPGADDEAVADHTVTGADTRSGSVRAGLAAVPDDAEVVIVHDAARPLASVALFAAVVDAVRDGADAALPGVPVVDTLRHRDGSAVDRDELVAVQTPQAFAAERLRAVHAAEPEATDDASLVEAAGGKVVVVPGEPDNAKITSPGDLLVAEARVRAAS
jgi:2-C-methyl-D-erythritol 4-phosphate cytidylyltransferase